MVPSGEQTAPQAAAGSIRLVETPGGEGTICVVFMPLTQAETPIPDPGLGLFVRVVDKFGFRTFAHSA